MLKLFEELGFAPRRCTWEITLACNLRCGHCGSRAGRPRDDELSTDEALRVADELADLGCRQVTLAGGEPTLRRDWPILVRRLRDRSVQVSLITNGMTWSERHLELARDAGLEQVAFSVDGLDAAHDEVRGVAGALRKVLSGIDQCVAGGLRVAAVTHVTRRNLDDLEALHALLGAHQVRSWQVQQGVPTGNLADDPEVVLPAEAMIALLERLGAIARSGRRPRVHAADNLGYYSEDEELLRGAGEAKLKFWLGCRAGLDVIGIESHGAVKGCLSLPSELNGRTDFIEGNLRERSLRDLWFDPEAFAYTRKFAVEKLQGACHGCAFGEVCRGGCTVTSVGHHGHPHHFPNCYAALTGRTSTDARSDPGGSTVDPAD